MYPPGPPAGWYPDPGGSGGWRWWDGHVWTPHLAAPSGPARAAVPQLVAAELRMVPWVLIAVAVLGVVTAATTALLVASVANFHAVGHWYHEVFRNLGKPGYTPPPAPPTFTNLGNNILGIDGLAVVQIPALIVFLVWQHRAARAARAAGYPAVHSPGWGVGSWFVPIVNLWMPFQALRDCLPPQAPNRNRVWLVLALGATGAVLSEAGFLTALFATAGGTPLVLLGGVCELGAYGAMFDVVRRTTAAHRALVGGTPRG